MFLPNREIGDQHMTELCYQTATALAAQSDEPPAVLRQRVTSKGGTTYAAITSMERDHVKEKFIAAMTAACSRAAELGVEFGAT